MDHLVLGLQPFLKWAGGKRWFVSRYKEVLAPLIAGRCVIEPFAGAGAFSLTLGAKQATLNDINPHLINLYNQIKTGGVSPPEQILNERAYFENARLEFNKCIADARTEGLRPAQLFWVLNRLGFNGLCRFNKKGFFNTPFGRYHRIHSAFNWSSYHHLFQNWDFFCGSYENINPGCDDFIFCDPPYDIAWQGYYQHDFPFERQKELAHWIANQRAPALIMNHPTERIIKLYESLNFEISYIPAPRTLAARPGSRKKCLEVIATHNFSWKERTNQV